MTIDWVHGVGQSPVCQILLQIAVRMLVTASSRICINSAGMLSTPADFFKDLTAASTFSRRIGKLSSSVCNIIGNHITLIATIDLLVQ